MATNAKRFSQCQWNGAIKGAVWRQKTQANDQVSALLRYRCKNANSKIINLKHKAMIFKSSLQQYPQNFQL